MNKQMPRQDLFALLMSISITILCLSSCSRSNVTTASSKQNAVAPPAVASKAAGSADEQESTFLVKTNGLAAYQTVFRGGTEWREGRYKKGVRGGALKNVLLC